MELADSRVMISYYVDVTSPLEYIFFQLHDVYLIYGDLDSTCYVFPDFWGRNLCIYSVMSHSKQKRHNANAGKT